MKVVGVEELDEVIRHISTFPRLALDTETFGLRPYHGHKLFSIIIAVSSSEAYYFNFQWYEGVGASYILPSSVIESLQRRLFSDPSKLWYLHNAKYDMAILAADNCELAGTIHCTKAQGLIEYNEHQNYDLDSSLRRIGLTKDEGPEKWIDDNKAFTNVQVPGRKQKKKDKHFFKVPFPIITHYGLLDGTGTYSLGESQVRSIQERSEIVLSQNAKALPVTRVMENERTLTKTVFKMERTGIHVDLKFCAAAAQREDQKYNECASKFQALTNKEYKPNSPVLFKEVFLSDKDKWEFNAPTKTGQVNPSFESDVLKKFTNPAAALVLQMRDAGSRSNFYTGFIYHADKNSRVHPNFNPDGAGHGRFSSSDPNFQNLTSDTVQVCLACGNEHEEILKECDKCGSKNLARKEWLVRQAIIPSAGFSLLSIDYDSMEYRFMLEYACIQVGYLTPLAKAVMEGADVHQAAADLATKVSGFPVTRRQAKTSNFLTLYGGGNKKLAEQLGIPLEQARAIRQAILSGAPEIDVLIRAVTRAAEQRGYIRNWLGRICNFPDLRFAYRAPNYLISGGCADIVKIAMNRVDELLAPYKSRMIMQVHDELNFEIAEGEEFLIPMIKSIMEGVFVGKYLTFPCSVYTSKTSLADLEEWAA